MKPNNHRILALVLLVLFVALPFLVFFFGGDGQGLKRDCREQCSPRSFKVEPDPAFHVFQGKQGPLKCTCY
jgi:hypothetical protein